ncbi:YifB family Mg chelatase-like AAA ATPase [Nocardia sp. XZ_19_369]|uniref:YifB family Mg chelatase-like AAA ATPase n=1 Tax=Nocardia sp. XZ_19_369 TaxID=2769487 RepID=UPI00188EEE8B|nr:YifB family Mg chelatase-like AAA ATPase [Nocardia sp. XZ_19_369]
MTIGVGRSVQVTGVSGQVIELYADLSHGLPSVTVIGDGMLRESRDRVRAALTNSGEHWPDSRVILAASAPVVEPSASHDLALAVGVLDATRVIPAQADSGTVFLGELCLDGRLRGERAVLPAVVTARDNNYRTVVVPEAALPQLGLVEGIEIVGARDLRAVLAWLRYQHPLAQPGRVELRYPPPAIDLAHVAGQPHAKWALEVAAAGGHHLALVGSPGVGKTLLAQCLPAILPPLTDAQALEVAAIASAAGVLDHQLISRMPPYIAAHHSASVPGMLGGGWRLLPGAVSRAHHGVLFLDEVTELGSKVCEALRTPLDCGQVHLGRAGTTVTYPARFQLIAAASECACAARTDGDCVCTPATRFRYWNRFTSAWADRLDIWVRLSSSRLQRNTAANETSAAVRERVTAARDAAARRWSEHGVTTNAEVPGEVLRHRFPLPPAVVAPVESALRAGGISTRGVDRVVRLAWTLCDLRAGSTPNAHDITDALLLHRRPALTGPADS